MAWRNIRDWVMAQLALYETEIVDMPQVFLPFATDQKGQTLYEKMVEGKFFAGGWDGMKKPRFQLSLVPAIVNEPGPLRRLPVRDHRTGE